MNVEELRKLCNSTTRNMEHLLSVRLCSEHEAKTELTVLWRDREKQTHACRAPCRITRHDGGDRRRGHGS